MDVVPPQGFLQQRKPGELVVSMRIQAFNVFASIIRLNLLTSQPT